MDVKGIAWAANFYQKFEALCLEVEEIMYQDTVKYVENQVQTVGASVKKFCSDVMEDLQPPSSLDPGKVMNSEFILEQFTDVDICKKPKPVIRKEPLKVDIRQLRKRTKAPPCMEKNHLAVTSTPGTHGVDNSFLSAAANSSEKEACSGISGPGALSNGTILKDLADCHSSEVLKRNLNMSSQETQSARLASSESAEDNIIGESSDEAENRNEAIPDPLVLSLPSNTSSLESESAPDSGRAKNLPSSEGFSAISQDVSGDSSMVSFGASSMNEDFFSNIYEEIGFSTSVDHSEKSNLEESCIFVNEDELQFVGSPSKSRTYKKKLRDVLSSRKRASRAQEYKQLASQFANNDKCKDESTPSSATALSSNKSSEISMAHGPGESEWELL